MLEMISLESKSFVNDFSFEESGKLLFAGCQNSKIHIWNLSKRRMISAFGSHSEQVRNNSQINCITNMNDRQIITGSKDRSVKLYDYQKHNCVKTFFTTSGVLDIKNSYKTIYSGNLDGNLRVFNTNSSYSTFNEKIFSHGRDNLPD